MSRFMVTNAVILLLLPRLAGAHPGHGAEVGLQHFLTDPFHLIVASMIAFAVLVLGASKRSGGLLRLLRRR